MASGLSRSQARTRPHRRSTSIFAAHPPAPLVLFVSTRLEREMVLYPGGFPSTPVAWLHRQLWSVLRCHSFLLRDTPERVMRFSLYIVSPVVYRARLSDACAGGFRSISIRQSLGQQSSERSLNRKPGAPGATHPAPCLLAAVTPIPANGRRTAPALSGEAWLWVPRAQ